MSTRTAFAVVGAAVGAYFGNPALGYAIGSMVGGYVDPVKSYGPKLTDAQTQTSQDGVPIPQVYGTARIAGNVIANGPLVQHKHKDDGKGSGQEAISYTYTRTYAIGIAKGPIVGIRRVWRNGKLVVDNRSVPSGDQILQSVMNRSAATDKFLNQSSVYLGDEEQLPDSELQAIFGVDNVAAYRGLAYIVVRNDDVTNTAGAVPQYEFEVVTSGTSVSPGAFRPLQFQTLPFGAYPQQLKDPRQPDVNYRYRGYFYNDPQSVPYFDNLNDAIIDIGIRYGGFSTSAPEIQGWSRQTTSSSGMGYTTTLIPPGHGPGVTTIYPYQTHGSPETDFDLATLIVSRYPGSRLSDPEPIGEHGRACIAYADSVWATRFIAWDTVGQDTGSSIFASGVIADQPASDANSPVSCETEGGGEGNLYYFADFLIFAQAYPGCNVGLQEGWTLLPDSPNWAVDSLGNLHNINDCTPVTGSFNQLQLYFVDTDHNILTYPVGPVLSTDDPKGDEAFWTAAYDDAVELGYMQPGLTFLVDYPKVTNEACYCSPGPVIDINPVPLRDIVSSVCGQASVTPDLLDVEALDDLVLGFVIATDATAADIINTIAPAYHFDGAEWDGKIRFVKRGNATVASIGIDQMVAVSDGPRVKETRTQEIEIPRKLTVSYQDPAADYQITTQNAERYLATVASTGTSSVSFPVVLETNKAKQVADILLKDKWSSLRGTLDFTLTDEWSLLCATDVLFIGGDDGAVFRARVGETTTQQGTVAITATQDLQSAYESNAIGTPPPAPTDTMDGPIGPTLAYLANLPALRDADDQPGFYAAVGGYLANWNGAAIELSSDGGATWRNVRTALQGSTMGSTTTALPAWRHSVPENDDTLTVQMVGGGQLSSITREQLFQGMNGALVGDQLIQFQTATYLGNGLYRLAGLTRGRKNTPTAAMAAGAPFALLDSLYFIPIDRALTGRTLSIRTTSLGTATSSGIVQAITLSPPRSVVEWAPTHVRAARAGTGDISLAWTPRARMGTSRTPYQSQWFNGYAVTVSNGTTARTYATTAASFAYTHAQQVADFGTAPVTLTYTITATNSVTGAGDTTGGTI